LYSVLSFLSLANAGAADYLKLLEPIKDEFSGVSWSDLIVLAGQTSIEAAGGYPMPFCGGRSDTDNGDKSIGLEPRIYNNNTYASIMYDIANKVSGDVFCFRPI
jgi:catalase (peroxidase I)